MLSKTNYLCEKWDEKFGERVSILTLPIHPSWKDCINMAHNVNVNIDDNLTYYMKTKKTIYPDPDLLFNAFNLTPLNEVKVVILGQDPYIGEENGIPQAMGLSFSVPEGMSIPSSLANIYKNMYKFGHINCQPDTGNLEKWARQGCLMLNAGLTVYKGESNSHTDMWKEFTNNIIEYINDNCENVVFVLWGGNAIKKLKYIDNNKHHVILSSHPSGLSCRNKIGQHPSFNEFDHFKEINEYLINNGKTKIEF